MQVEGQVDQSDQIVSQAKEGIDLLMKEQLPGQDCGCTNSGDGGARDCSKSCGCDIQDEKRDNDCLHDLNGMYKIERKKKNERTEVCYVPEVFVSDIPAMRKEKKKNCVELRDRRMIISPPVLEKKLSQMDHAEEGQEKWWRGNGEKVVGQ
ncbi:hypothetical protein Bpfe_017215 [Biomphalaria pfeifferi]|uniref:Uncharacterized protein n=1 Tax=Biomphalaria pfeifferi TaxID=112525 RepID=A0AAD8F7W6_BIOPF|nr:hypothetical protein Bpfe_017215 [Biomphalaria pfeifferi]